MFVLGKFLKYSSIYKRTLINSLEIIDHNEKDGGMYILPECSASVKSKWLKKDDTKSPNDGKF